MPAVSRPLRPDWVEIPQAEFRAAYRELGSLRELAEFWRIPPAQLSYYAYHIDKRQAYRAFSIPRRYGRKRNIEAPVRTLKYIQRILHESLSRVYGPHPAVHGFVPHRSVVTNAQTHVGQRYVLNIDLADYFPSITRKRIFGRLTSEPYSFQPSVASAIASVSTNVFAQLPQGSPSSPVIANIITAGMDADIAKLCGRLRCRYTRYADDISISRSRGEMPPQIARYPNASGTGQVVIGDELANVIESHSFEINHRKSRLQSYWTRQMCTGLVVNGDRPSLRRPYIRRLRSLIDHWQKHGWQVAARVLHSSEGYALIEDRQSFVNYVMGKIGYLKMVRGQDDKVAQRLDLITKAIPKYH